MNPMPRSPIRSTLGCLLGCTVALAGCALGQGEGSSGAVGTAAAAAARSSGAARADGAESIRPGEPRYIRYRADETGLTAAIDDGANTYIEFDAPADPALSINDQDGRALVWTRVGPVVAIVGLHQGVLLRRGERASFFSPNPRWQGRVAMTLPARADYAEARARLENQALLQAAMERALVASSPRAGSPDQAAGATGFQAMASRPLLARSGQIPMSSEPANLQPGMLRSTTAALAPLTTANLSASAPEQGLIRVFFASASRSIVAPDDGLATLMREAPRADEIRITGFTDSLGSKESNLRLARSRADAVAQILLRRGLAVARIVIDAVAGEEFLADNETDRGRALNRRAEVVLIKDGRPMLLGSARN